jgi:hypothetical protein
MEDAPVLLVTGKVFGEAVLVGVRAAWSAGG